MLYDINNSDKLLLIILVIIIIPLLISYDEKRAENEIECDKIVPNNFLFVVIINLSNIVVNIPDIDPPNKPLKKGDLTTLFSYG